MSEFETKRHCWSWRSCFASVKHKKIKTKKQQNHTFDLPKTSSNVHKHLQTTDENSNILCEFDLSTEGFIPNEMLLNENIDCDNLPRTVNDINSKIINQKSSVTVKPTHLDAIVEDSNEENSDEIIQPVRLYGDCELIDDSNDLYSRLFDLSKMNHIIIQFNDNGCLLADFIRQLGKLKLKIDDIKRASTEISHDTELLEAKYSTLLATIESLSLLLKVAQISSPRSLINRLVFSIEQRMAQLNRLVHLSSSINARQQQQQDPNDDDFLSFRSAFSSYEHLLSKFS